MSADAAWADVLNTWFGESRESVDGISSRMAWWFGSDSERDNELEHRYGSLCKAALSGQLNDWQKRAQSRLALILLLDQFPRNLYRGTPGAFSGDDRAAMLCLSGAHAGLDRKLEPVERIFFYMPLQHAEDLVTQQVSVRLYEGLAAEQSGYPVFEGVVDYARLHRDLVERFGRFPHRNEILGRTSTEEELKYLEDGGERFGQ